MTLEDAAARGGGRFVPVRPAELVERSPGVGYPEGHPAFRTTREELPRLAVVELPGGRVFGTHRAPLTGSGELIHEIGWVHGTMRDRPMQHPVLLRPRLPDPTHLHGRIGVLASRSDSNYCHFLVDVLPRVQVLRDAGSAVAPVDAWLVPTERRWQRELLELLPGFDTGLVIPAQDHRHVQAETLVVPSVASNWPHWMPPWVIRWLRDQLLPDPEAVPLGPPVYVTRNVGGAAPRQVRNEASVRELLTDRGFVVVDAGQLSVSEQIATFAAAPLVVGPHGAALTNLAFARKGAGVIELFPDWANLPDCFWRLATALPSLRYRYLAGPRLQPSETFFPAQADDITVDLDQLRRLLDELG